MVFVCASASNHSCSKFSCYIMSLGKKVCYFCFCSSFSKYVATCILTICTCVLVCVCLVHSNSLSLHSTLEREITNFCQPLPLSICCCLLSLGCWPYLSVKCNAVASNPSRDALFDAHWQSQALDALVFHVCLNMCMAYCPESFICAQTQTTQTAWLLSGTLASFHLQFTALLQSI